MDYAPYCTEHALMDAEHRAVQQWAEEAVLRLRRAQPFEDCVYALDVLTHLARSHFAHEEIEMHTMGYPAVSAHVLDHRLLLDELARLRNGLAAACGSASGRAPRRALVERLSAWMLPHIEGHDGGYALWLRRRGAGRVPNRRYPCQSARKSGRTARPAEGAARLTVLRFGSSQTGRSPRRKP